MKPATGLSMPPDKSRQALPLVPIGMPLTAIVRSTDRYASLRISMVIS